MTNDRPEKDQKSVVYLVPRSNRTEAPAPQTGRFLCKHPIIYDMGECCGFSSCSYDRPAQEASSGGLAAADVEAYQSKTTVVDRRSGGLGLQGGDMTDHPETALGAFYEVLPEFRDATGNARLMAAFTPSNGIRIGIVNDDMDMVGWAEFDFTEDQAEAVGHALVRWAQRLRAEAELVRCNSDKGVRP